MLNIKGNLRQKNAIFILMRQKNRLLTQQRKVDFYHRANGFTP